MPPHVLLQHPIHYWKLYVLSVGFHDGSVYGHVAYKVLSHAHPVATTPDLKQKLQVFIESNSADPKKRLSTSETITRGNLGFFVFLSALSAKTHYVCYMQSKVLYGMLFCMTRICIHLTLLSWITRC